MLPGIRGPLVSRDFAETSMTRLFAGRLGEATREEARRALVRLWHRAAAALGPASGLRAVVDLSVWPLLELLGFRVRQAIPWPPASSIGRTFFLLDLATPGGTPVPCVVTRWTEPLDPLWRDVVRCALPCEACWALASNGRALRLIDARRTYARRFLEFDIELASSSDGSFAVLWALARAGSLEPSAPTREDAAATFVDEVVARSDQAGVRVCRSLEAGVREALGVFASAFAADPQRVSRAGRSTDGAPRTPPAKNPAVAVDDAFDQALTVIYRILFMLFAEARCLVPVWHPIYRDSYTIGTLAESLAATQRPRGIWPALQAITRLAHDGCEAGDLVVTAFNGRLFSPSHAPLAARVRVDDAAVREALVALTTSPGTEGAGRARISYGDLGVEQLGAVYEHVLDFTPVVRSASGLRAGAPVVSLDRGGLKRKSSGTFYTPRSITDYLVRATLAPLVAGASSDRILDLKVVDPAMGSGAFLVSACRYLASAFEAALVREGAANITDGDRAVFRRLVAQRCLYGVDLNPMAVQLARLSIWLTTLAADRPLSFLDHHLRTGDSLIGASIADIARQPPGVKASRSRPGRLPLFEPDDLAAMLQDVVLARCRLALEPDESAAVVQAKERSLHLLASAGSALARWKTVADLWCACWYWRGNPPCPGRAVFGALTDWLLRDHLLLPEQLAREWSASGEAIAANHRFFHWTLEFPEVFFDQAGQPLAAGGFDAILGNPPWDMLRADLGDRRARDASRQAVRAALRFVRDSGTYRLQAAAHPNRYQLFLERAMSLVRPGGRLGLVLPAGLLVDAGSRHLRRELLERWRTDALLTFDNRRGIFPIHRGVRFVLALATRGGRTISFRCRSGIDDASWLDTLPDGVADSPPDSFPLSLTPGLIERISGADLTIPDAATALDLSLADALASRAPALGSQAGWDARFGRELNATDDRAAFVPRPRDVAQDVGQALRPGARDVARAFRPGAQDANRVSGGALLPVLEGKHIGPFSVDLERAALAMPRSAARRRLEPAATFARSRLAYRDVASPANRMTLIAAILPAGVVSTHTLFCLKTALDENDQRFLCGILNSYVANYLVRGRVVTHVTTRAVESLPVPRPPAGSAAVREIVDLVKLLMGSATKPVSAPGRESDARAPFSTDAARVEARLQALVARLYGLTAPEFRHILDTFPLVERERRDAALEAFQAAQNEPFVAGQPGI
jgi:hypothetical protein